MFLGHLDYIVRYGPYEDKTVDHQKYQDIIDEIFKTLIQKGKGIEVNTSGYRDLKTCGFPNFEQVQRYYDLGGRIITIGTDSHTSDRVGENCLNVAKKYHVTREEQDAFAVRSHQRACKAIKEGKFKDEILPVELKDRKGNVTIFDTDEGPREGQSMEKLAKLRPCFVKGGTVTAANSSSLNDGAAAVVVMSKEKQKNLG